MCGLSDDISSEQSKLVVVNNTRQIMLMKQADDIGFFETGTHAQREISSARVVDNHSIEMK